MALAFIEYRTGELRVPTLTSTDPIPLDGWREFFYSPQIVECRVTFYKERFMRRIEMFANKRTVNSISEFTTAFRDKTVVDVKIPLEYRQPAVTHQVFLLLSQTNRDYDDPILGLVTYHYVS